MNRLPQHTATVSALFQEHQPRLKRQLSNIVRTSAANIDDACAYAWMQLLRHPPQSDSTYSWLLTVAVRYAIKLDREGRRELGPEPAEAADTDPVDLHDAVLQHEQTLDAAATIQRAHLTARELRILSLHVAGYSYDEISAVTTDSLRTVERQLLRARRKLRAACP